MFCGGKSAAARSGSGPRALATSPRRTRPTSTCRWRSSPRARARPAGSTTVAPEAPNRRRVASASLSGLSLDSRRSRAGTSPGSTSRPRCALLFWLVEQRLELRLQVGGAAVLLGRLEGVHRRPVVAAGTRRRTPPACPAKSNVYVSRTNEIFSAGTPAAAKRSTTLALDAPRHRADEALRRRRRVRGADLQDLRHQRRVVRDPVAHDDAAAGPRHAHHLLGHVERLGREHRAEDADDEVERCRPRARCRSQASPSWNRQLVRPCSLARRLPGLDEVARDVDAEHVGAELAPRAAPSCRRRSRGRAP